MFIYYQPQASGTANDIYGVWGNKRFHLNNMDKVGHFKNMVKGATGSDCKEYHWERGSEQIKKPEASKTERLGCHLFPVYFSLESFSNQSKSRKHTA